MFVEIFYAILYIYIYIYISRSRSRSIKFSMTPFNGDYIISYLMVKVTFALSIGIYEIFSKQINFKKFDFENKVNVKEENNGSCAIRLKMFDSM